MVMVIPPLPLRLKQLVTHLLQLRKLKHKALAQKDRHPCLYVAKRVPKV